MSISTAGVLKAALCIGSLVSLAHASPVLDERNSKPTETITVDVCIVGGGSTGTYSAVRLSEAFGKTVVVIEKTGRLGGHTETYIDPVTTFPVDYGVFGWHNISLVTDYFARLGVGLSAVPLSNPFTTAFIDLKTGKVVPNYAPPDPIAGLFALAGLLQQ